MNGDAPALDPSPASGGGGQAALVALGVAVAAGLGVYLLAKGSPPASACRPRGGPREALVPDKAAYYRLHVGAAATPADWGRIQRQCCPNCGADDLAWDNGFASAAAGSPDSEIYLPTRTCTSCRDGDSLAGGGTPTPTPSPVLYHVTAPKGLIIRAGPGSWCPQVGFLPLNATVQIVCQSRGERIVGSSVWDAITVPSPGGGWVSDYWVSTPGVDVMLPTVANCQTQACPGTPVPVPAPQPPPPAPLPSDGWPRVGWIVGNGCSVPGAWIWVIASSNSSTVGIVRRPVSSVFAFTSCGYKTRYVHRVSDAVLAQIPVGDPIQGLVQVVGPAGAYTINTCPGVVSLAPGDCPG